MKSKILTLFILIAFISGCAVARKLKIEPPSLREAKITEAKVEIKPPAKTYRAGENFIYHIRWFGIPVGDAVMSIPEITELNGRKVYHLKAEVESSKWFSMIFKIKDRLDSYVDVEGLYPLKFERYQREGGYKAEEIMEYDHINRTATYKSLLNKSVKTMEIPQGVQDMLSCIYWIRLQEVKPGNSIFVDVNADEKNWKLEVKVLGSERIEMLNLGVYDAFLVEPIAQFRGAILRKGKMWVWVSADERRIPLILKAETPFGPIVTYLHKME
jgi:hypothetical protein